jgi:hypothetical protein
VRVLLELFDQYATADKERAVSWKYAERKRTNSSRRKPVESSAHLTPFIPNINYNVVPFTPRPSKWSLSLNYFDSVIFNFFTSCLSSTYPDLMFC